MRHVHTRPFRLAPTRHDSPSCRGDRLGYAGDTRGTQMSAATGFVGVRWGSDPQTHERPRSARRAGFSPAGADAGGGTRTPDTRIMIPRRFGSGAPFPAAGGHRRGHFCCSGVVSSGGCRPRLLIRRGSLGISDIRERPADDRDRHCGIDGVACWAGGGDPRIEGQAPARRRARARLPGARRGDRPGRWLGVLAAR